MCSYKENQVQRFCQFPSMDIIIAHTFNPNVLTNTTLKIVIEVSTKTIVFSCLKNYGQANSLT